jgi:hypothetical protein
MYRHLLAGHRRLMRDGATAEAIVLDVRWLSGSGIRYKIRARARFADGSHWEFSCHVDDHELLGSTLGKGDVVPVRYDANERSHIDLDLPRIQANVKATRKSVDDAVMRRAEDEQRKHAAAEQADAHPESALTPELHAKLAELKRQYRDRELTYDEVEARTQQLDAEQDGQLTRFLEAAEYYERHS